MFDILSLSAKLLLATTAYRILILLMDSIYNIALWQCLYKLIHQFYKEHIMKNFNRQYRDSLFKIVFNSKYELLSLYNAISGKNLTNPEELTINTLEDAVYVGLKNDLSFIFDDSLSIYEHQSTFTPNLALRGFFYIADLYKGMYYTEKIYTKSRIYILTPKLVVFYNGSEDIPDILEQHLSDSFVDKNAKSDLEVTAHIYNINFGHNNKLMEKCPKLYEYCCFVDRAKKALNNRANNDVDINSVLNSVIDDCIVEGILADILSRERDRVMNTILAQFDAEKYIEYERDYGRNEGFELCKNIFQLYMDGNSPQEISDKLNVPLENILSFLDK